MVNKKGTKRKTRWRTLSIGDGGGGTDTTTSDGGTTIYHHHYEERRKSANTSSSHHPYTNGTTKYAQSLHNSSSSVAPPSTLTTTNGTNNTSSNTTPPPTTQSSAYNGDKPSRYNNTYDTNRNYYYNRNSDKFSNNHHHHNHNSSVFNSHHSSYKRRPFSTQNNTSNRHYGSTSGSTVATKSSPNSWRSCRTGDTFDNKENSTTKPLFNEDDYTRITTPRQDVLFKKGYLSRPKKYTSITPNNSIDTNTSSSGAMSVVSTEESMSSSIQSFSPEHGSSEICDPDQPFMYPGFYDQNGVFFVNPFLSNGFDPYGGQMMMMPYGGPPYSINQTEYYSSEAQPYPADDDNVEPQPKRNSIDSQNSPDTPSSDDNEISSTAPDINETTNTDIVLQLPNNEEDIPVVAADSLLSEDAASAKDEIDAAPEMEPVEPVEPVELVENNNPDENLINIPPHYCQQYYYPYMIGPPPPFIQFNEIEYNENNGGYTTLSYNNRHNRFKKRKRRPFRSTNSTGISATTTDYSEDDESTDNEHLLDQPIILHPNAISFVPGLPIAQFNDVISHTTLNTNVSEFVPRHHQHIATPPATTTTLNVEVEEFHPRNYQPYVANSSSSVGTDDPMNNDPPVAVETLNAENDGQIIRKNVEITTQNNTNNNNNININISSTIPETTNIKKNNNKLNHTGSNSSNNNNTFNSAIRSSDSPRRRNSDNNRAIKATSPGAVSGITEQPSMSRGGLAKFNKIDQVNAKSDLVNKVVMHPKQSENILENVKKLNFVNAICNSNNSNSGSNKGNKSNKTSPKRVEPTFVGGEGRKHQKPQPSPQRQSSVDKTHKTNGAAKINKKIVALSASEKIPSGMEKKIEGPTYAQMVGPAVAVKADEKSTPADLKANEEDPIVVALLKATNVQQPPPPPKWQTVRPKGKKRHQQQQCELADDFWEEREEEIVEKSDIIEIVPPKTEILSEKIDESMDTKTSQEEQSVTPAVVAIRNKMKDKSAKKSKAKKNTKKTNTSGFEITEPKYTVNVKPSISDEFTTISTVATNNVCTDIDTSDFNFETDPSIFVNAITPSAIYTDPSVDKTLLNTSGSGFSLNASRKYDFSGGAVTKLNDSIRLLKDEEEMVMRVMKSLSVMTTPSLVEIKRADIKFPPAIPVLNEYSATTNKDDVTDKVNEVVKIAQEVYEIQDEGKKMMDKFEIEAISSTNEAYNCANSETNNQNIFIESHSVDVKHIFSNGKEAENVILDEVKEGVDKLNELNGECPELDGPIKKSLCNGQTNGHRNENEYFENDGNSSENDEKSCEEFESVKNFDKNLENIKKNVSFGNGNDFEQIENIENGHIETIETIENIIKFEKLNRKDVDRDYKIKQNGIELLANIDVQPITHLASCKMNGNAAIPTISPAKIPNHNDETDNNDEEVHLMTPPLLMTSSNEPSDNDFVLSDLSSADTVDDDDDDDNTVIAQLDEYIEDIMVDMIINDDPMEHNKFPDCDDEDDMILDTVNDGEIEALIKQAEEIVRLSTGVGGAAWNITPSENGVSSPNESGIFIQSNGSDLYKEDRIESPRNSEDSGILENHDDVNNSSGESDSGEVDANIPASKFSLTQVVSQWLTDKQKEKSPIPLLRVPSDPVLSEKIEKSFQRQHITEMLKGYADYEDDNVDEEDIIDTSEDECDVETKAPVESKNLKSNPLLVLSAKERSRDNNDTCKRVATINKPDAKIQVLGEPDILDYWENDPMLPRKHQNNKQSSIRKNVGNSTIDYAKLLASVATKTTDDILLLSNNTTYHHFDNNLRHNPISTQTIIDSNRHNVNDSNNQSQSPSTATPVMQSLPYYANPNNNHDDGYPTRHSNSSSASKSSATANNYFKPPEICCILM